jgi:hypothetical protein
VDYGFILAVPVEMNEIYPLKPQAMKDEEIIEYLMNSATRAIEDKSKTIIDQKRRLNDLMESLEYANMKLARLKESLVIRFQLKIYRFIKRFVG